MSLPAPDQIVRSALTGKMAWDNCGADIRAQCHPYMREAAIAALDERDARQRDRMLDRIPIGIRQEVDAMIRDIKQARMTPLDMVRDVLEERYAIREFDGGMTRKDADALTRAEWDYKIGKSLHDPQMPIA